MLTKIRIQNFKQFDDVEIELGQTVVFIGPNNSGKTTALQALALWELGLRKWRERRKTSRERAGVVINRKDVISIPVPNASLLWRNLKVRGAKRQSGKQENVYIYIELNGLDEQQEWRCKLSFNQVNSESFYSRFVPETKEDSSPSSFASDIRIAFLPPMSGLVREEDRLELPSIQRRIGEGRTAEILRNLCYRLFETDEQNGNWHKVVNQIKEKFGVELLPPQYDEGLIVLSYKDRSGVTLDLSASGRGMLQVLLLLAYMYNNPGAVLLLDEPDAHLEIIRQHSIYDLLTSVGKETNSQIIIASHSEVIMDKAFGRDLLISFAGKPKRVNTTSAKTQLGKSLRYISANQYFQADVTGWCLYLEGETDLAILQRFAALLNHDAVEALREPFVRYVGNVPSNAREPFFGLRHYKPDLVGVALFDRDPVEQLQTGSPLMELAWRRREIENYLCMPETLLAYARSGVSDESDAARREGVMQQVINDTNNAFQLLGQPDLWSPDRNVSVEGLPAVFDNFYKRLGLPNLMLKTNFHTLVPFIPKEKIDPEVAEKLDAIVQVARQAKPYDD
jgi:ABC-type taurine transport system ATPase subunit